MVRGLEEVVVRLEDRAGVEGGGLLEDERLILSMPA
jgi:hypothetical protein